MTDTRFTEEERTLILTALHERKNRLLKVDADGSVSPHSVATLRSRITECNRLIRKLSRP